MKENEILRTILRDIKTGWWEADTTHRILRLSDTLSELLGRSDGTLSFEEFGRLVGESYRDYAFSPDRYGKRTYPLRIDGREVWISSKLLSEESTAEGSRILTGYARLLDPQPGAAGPETDRIDDLLFRLRSISETLLSLLHTDRVNTAVDKILTDILHMFRGDRAYIVEFDWARRMHVCTFEVTASGVNPEREAVNRIMMDDLTWWTECISKGAPVVLSTLDQLPPEAAVERAVLEAQNIKSLIVMPLVSRDRVWGYAGIDIVEAVREWSNVDCQWFSSLVNIISLCLELQRSEQVARDERTYLQRLYRHMPMGYVRLEMIYDAEGRATDYRVTESNLAADKIVGLKREAYVGRTALELGLAPESILGLMNRVLDTGEYYESDTLLESTGRFVHSILYTTRPDEIICLFSDTTDVRKAHEAIARNERLLRTIFDNIQVGVELYDKDGYMVDINNKDMEIFGVASKEDALGINFYDNPNIPEDVREGVRAGHDQAFRVDYPFDRLAGYYPSKKTGLLEIFSTANLLYDMQGNLVNFMLINIDNTEINRAHSRLAEFESSFSLVSRFGKVGYCRFDLLSKEGYGLPQWYYNLGEKEDTPLAEVIGVYSHVDPVDRAAILECIGRVKQGLGDSFGLDLRIERPEGDTWTRINVMRNPMNNDPSKIEMVCVNYDITELKQTERNLIEAKNKAEISDRLKSAFLANMSHEIRTPLNAIVGFSNLLAETEDIGERREFMRVVEENNDLLLKLISDILDLSKIEAGTFEFDYGPVQVDQLCEEAVRSLGLKVQGRPIELVFEPHDEPCSLYGDKNRLLQIITNFINNALKFTQKGYIALRYSVTDGMVRFEVEDTGSGIPYDKQPTVFDRFVKLNSFVQGTGLGLSICKSIVEQMGGRIGVESEPGRGSLFWFTVPTGKSA
ncbi:ATP-binding protein [Alistipes sp.]|uniref:sensor histidine kinase n=1 Tax=Alistipes sp. TaxID=1872444 RepID=UPI003AF1957D